MAATLLKELPGQIKPQKLSMSHAGARIWPLFGVPNECSISSPILRLEDHKDEVLTCDFHPTGKLFLSSGSDTRIHVGDVYGDYRNFMVMSGHTEAVMEAHFSRTGFNVYSCSNDRTLGIWDTFTGVRTARLEGHTNCVNSVQGTRSSLNILCSGSDDGAVRIWDAREKKCALIIKTERPVNATCFSETGECVIFGGEDSNLQMLDLRTNQIICTLSGHKAEVTGISLSPCGSYLLSHAKDNSLRIWQIRPTVVGGRCVGFFQTNQSMWNDNLLRCSWSPDGTKISAGSSNGNVYVWDAMNGQMIYELKGHDNDVNDVVFHPQEPVLLSASRDTYLLFHEMY